MLNCFWGQAFLSVEMPHWDEVRLDVESFAALKAGGVGQQKSSAGFHPAEPWVETFTEKLW